MQRCLKTLCLVLSCAVENTSVFTGLTCAGHSVGLQDPAVVAAAVERAVRVLAELLAPAVAF